VSAPVPGEPAAVTAEQAAYEAWAELHVLEGHMSFQIWQAWDEVDTDGREIWKDIAHAAVAAAAPAAPRDIRTCYCGTTAAVVPGVFPHPDCDGSVPAAPQPAPELACPVCAEVGGPHGVYQCSPEVAALRESAKAVGLENIRLAVQLRETAADNIRLRERITALAADVQKSADATSGPVSHDRHELVIALRRVLEPGEPRA
jgi:hypothetical protein